MTVQRHNPAYRLASFFCKKTLRGIALQREVDVAFSNRCRRMNFASEIHTPAAVAESNIFLALQCDLAERLFVKKEARR